MGVMPLNDGRKGRFRQILVLLTCCALTAYFVYHAIEGRHGLEARSHLERRAAALTGEMSRLEAIRSALERDIALLRESTLDRDMLDERARDLLNLIAPDDVLIAP